MVIRTIESDAAVDFVINYVDESAMDDYYVDSARWTEFEGSLKACSSASATCPRPISNQSSLICSPSAIVYEPLATMPRNLPPPSIDHADLIGHRWVYR
jgi:hypothetical protein